VGNQYIALSRLTDEQGYRGFEGYKPYNFQYPNDGLEYNRTY